MSSTKTPDQVDVRGPRFVAWITTVVLVITLIVSGVSLLAAAVILGLQAVVFAVGAVGGPRRHPYAQRSGTKTKNAARHNPRPANHRRRVCKSPLSGLAAACFAGVQP